MTVDDDRELFLRFCRGVLETCAQVIFDGSRFGVSSSELRSRRPGVCVSLDFSEAEFHRAVAVTGESAEGLWPDRPHRRRAVQLMLVHVDEGIASTHGPADAYVVTLPDGFVSVRSTGPGSVLAEAAARAERERIAALVEEGRRQGHTFEWR